MRGGRRGGLWSEEEIASSGTGSERARGRERSRGDPSASQGPRRRPAAYRGRLPVLRKPRPPPRLPDRRVFGPLPPVDEPPGDGPSGGGVFPPDEDDLLSDLDDDVHGGEGATGPHSP